MDCPECGSPVPESESRCPTCQRPEAGFSRRAPEGSDAPEGEPTRPKFWNVVFWVLMGAALVAALMTMFGG